MVDIAMDPEVAAPIVERFASLADELEQVRWSFLSQATAVDDACGEFSASVADGTDGFQVSWRSAADTCAVTAGLISGNTNVFDLELQRLDADLAQVPDISGG